MVILLRFSYGLEIHLYDDVTIVAKGTIRVNAFKQRMYRHQKKQTGVVKNTKPTYF